MGKWLSTVSLLAGCLLAPGFALAQEPRLPAMPSLDQKGSDDMSKPAGAEKPAPPPKKSEEPKKIVQSVSKPHASAHVAAKQRVVVTHAMSKHQVMHARVTGKHTPRKAK